MEPESLDNAATAAYVLWRLIVRYPTCDYQQPTECNVEYFLALAVFGALSALEVLADTESISQIERGRLVLDVYSPRTRSVNACTSFVQYAKYREFRAYAGRITGPVSRLQALYHGTLLETLGVLQASRLRATHVDHSRGLQRKAHSESQEQNVAEWRCSASIIGRLRSCRGRRPLPCHFRGIPWTKQ